MSIFSHSFPLLAAADCRLITPSCTHEKLSDNHTGFFSGRGYPMKLHGSNSSKHQSLTWEQMLRLQVIPVAFTATDIFSLLEQNISPSPWYKNIIPLLERLISQITALNSKPEPANKAEAYGRAPPGPRHTHIPALSPIHSRLQSLQARFQQVKGLEEECGTSATNGATHKGL